MTLDITFRHMNAHPELEALIQERFARLRELHERITTCHVTVEPHDGLYEVHIGIDVPGAYIDIVQTDRSVDDHASLEAAIREAFQKAKRRLIAHLERTHERR